MHTIKTSTPVEITNLIKNHPNIFWNLEPEELIKRSLSMGMGELSNNDVLAIDTGEFTGRAPKDRFIVQEDNTTKNIDWGKINQPIEENKYCKLKNKLIQHLKKKKLFGRHCYACSDNKYKINIELITEFPWSNLFGYNMFLRPTKNELKKFTSRAIINIINR